MTDIPDWVLFEAAKRANWYYNTTAADKGLAELREDYAADNPMFRALCDMIAKYEKQPADRKLLIARQAAADTASSSQRAYDLQQAWLNGEYDDDHEVRSAVRAIELWEAGQ